MSYNVFDANKPKKPNNENNVFAEFLQKKGLYDSIEINKDNIDDLIALIAGKVKINIYCPSCKEMRVFSMIPIISQFSEENGITKLRPLGQELQYIQQMIDSINEGEIEWLWRDSRIEPATRIMVFSFVCAMDESHHLDYIVVTDSNQMEKIGQYPSFADLTFPELGVYNKVMSSDDREEFGRAIGLYASGIGVGSYVYLRRILERLLMQAKENAGDEIDTDAFNRGRVGEKITILSDYLPAMLTSNREVYGILSKGVHGLTEEECLTFFPVVKDCIYMILDQWEAMRRKKQKERSISAELSKIASKIT